jgi:hypothetical protein
MCVPAVVRVDCLHLTIYCVCVCVCVCVWAFCGGAWRTVGSDGAGGDGGETPTGSTPNPDGGGRKRGNKRGGVRHTQSKHALQAASVGASAKPDASPVSEADGTGSGAVVVTPIDGSGSAPDVHSQSFRLRFV